MCAINNNELHFEGERIHFGMNSSSLPSGCYAASGSTGTLGIRYINYYNTILPNLSITSVL